MISIGCVLRKRPLGWRVASRPLVLGTRRNSDKCFVHSSIRIYDRFQVAFQLLCRSRRRLRIGHRRFGWALCCWLLLFKSRMGRDTILLLWCSWRGREKGVFELQGGDWLGYVSIARLEGPFGLGIILRYGSLKSQCFHLIMYDKFSCLQKESKHLIAHRGTRKLDLEVTCPLSNTSIRLSRPPGFPTRCISQHWEFSLHGPFFMNPSIRILRDLNLQNMWGQSWQSSEQPAQAQNSQQPYFLVHKTRRS